MNIDLTQIIVAIIGLCGSLITAFVIPWIKSKIDTNQQVLLLSFAKTAVYAAQQIYDASDGDKKKAYALEQVKDCLNKRKIRIDDTEISEVIESALKEIKTELNGAW